MIENLLTSPWNREHCSLSGRCVVQDLLYIVIPPYTVCVVNTPCVCTLNGGTGWHIAKLAHLSDCANPVRHVGCSGSQPYSFRALAFEAPRSPRLLPA